MRSLFKSVCAQMLFLALCLIPGLLSAHPHGHTDVVVGGHTYHPHERVYMEHPWYHRDHVVFYNGAYYPNYYAGYPYYYYTPQFYYYDTPPAGVNINLNL